MRRVVRAGREAEDDGCSGGGREGGKRFVMSARASRRRDAACDECEVVKAGGRGVV